MKNLHLPAFDVWQLFTCVLAKLPLFIFSIFLQKTGKRLLAVLVMVLCASGSLFSQTNWTGNTSTSWNTASNWSAGVPDANDLVYIPNVTNNPTISTSNAVAKSVVIEAGGELTVTSTGTLTIEGSTTNGLYVNYTNTYGKLTNNGVINIGNNLPIGQHGIINYGIINNNASGVITINNAGQAGILNGEYGSFTNGGTINIGNAGDVAVGLQNNSDFFNSGSGQININQSTSAGLANITGTFINSATINIGSTFSVGGYGLVNQTIFNNNTGGQININRSATIGLSNDAGTFNNAATVNIGSLANVGLYGLKNEAIYNNNTGGQTNIDRSTTVGVWNYLGGGFNNTATLNIGSTATVGVKCIYNEASFNNLGGGVINANNSTQYAVENYENGVFSNYPNATINIGSLSSVGQYGLVNWEIFNTGGQINIDRCSFTGIANFSSLNCKIANQGTITIGGIASAGERGLVNNNTTAFNNEAGGQIIIDRVTTHGIWNSGTFNNWATITIGNNAATSIVGYALLNDAVFVNEAGTINLNRSTDARILNYSSFTNKATINIGSVGPVGKFCIYTTAVFNNNAGGVINANNSWSRAIQVAAGTFTNAATINIGSLSAVGLYGLHNAATFNNSAGGQINIDRSTTAGINNSGGTFTNSSTIKIGQITSIAALIESTSGNVINNTGGTLKGTGSIAANFFTNAGGTLSPGYSPGKLTFSGAENFANSAMTMEVNGVGTAGVQFDQVVVSGTATLGGTLNLSINYTPAGGDYVAILTATQVSGTFASVTGLPAAWDIIYSANEVGLKAKDITTWTGSTGTNWFSAGNWSLGVPTANMDALIPDVANDPIISAAGAVARSLKVNAGAVLTIGAAGTLTVNGLGTQGSQGVLNNGTVTNSGIINVGSTTTVGQYGITNNSIFNNNVGGQINLDRSTGSALLNAAGTFNNAATITIGALAAVGTTGISNAAIITNNAGGTINIDRSSIRGINNITGSFSNAGTLNIGTLAASSIQLGMENDAAFSNTGSGQININRSTSVGLWNSAGTFTNAATLNIGSTAAVGLKCIYNENIFNNNTGGTINANNASQYGIENFTGTFTNAATINIGSSAAVGTNGLRNAATFNNNAGGQLNLDRSSGSALLNAAGTFSNVATITIGNNAASAMTYGIENAVAFTNSGSGQININRSTSGGIWNQTTGTFTNSATLTIGSTAAIGQRCIYNTGTFNNNTGGTINANNASQYGIENFTGTFTNTATINIGSLSAVGTNGLRNAATFNNNAGGQLNLDRSSGSALLNAAGTFSNVATITIGNNAASAMTYGIENAVAFTNSGSGQININRSTSGGIWNQTTGTFTNSATLTLGSTAAIGQRCIYNTGTFNNNTGGVINANNASLYGIEHVTGTFTNAATINIGSLAAAGAYGLRNSSTFNNNAGGLIKIDRSTSFGLRNNAGTFTNSATLTIGSLSAVGTTGISNAAAVINNPSGTINLDRSTVRGIVNVTGTFANAGILTIGALPASSIAYGIENTATFNNNVGGQINIDRTTTSGIYASASMFTNQGNITIGALVPVTNLVTANTGTYSNVAGGILKGTGNLAAANFSNAGGTLSPGYSPGKMTFTGDEDFVNNTLIMEVNGTGMAGVDFDQVVVNGTATLGGTLALSINFAPVSGDHVTLLNSTVISGTFNNVTGLPADWHVEYTPNSVVLIFGSLLPVELTEFSARLVEQAVQLDWRTATEHNNEGFFIERSSDALRWEDIGFVPGHGTTAGPNIYSFLDEKPLSSLTGGCTGSCVNYYRLRQVDFGGQFDYSDIVSVEVDGQEGRPVLFPNPASTEVQVQLPQEFSKGNLAVFDEAGRLVLSQELAARSQTVSLVTADLVAGIYFCQIQLDGAVFVERLQIW